MSYESYKIRHALVRHAGLKPCAERGAFLIGHVRKVAGRHRCALNGLAENAHAVELDLFERIELHTPRRLGENITGRRGTVTARAARLNDGARACRRNGGSPGARIFARSRTPRCKGDQRQRQRAGGRPLPLHGAAPRALIMGIEIMADDRAQLAGCAKVIG